MELKVWSEEINKATSFSLLNTSGNRINICEEESESEKMLNEQHFKCYSTPLFSIVHFCPNCNKINNLKCDFEGDCIVLSFQRKGRMCCELCDAKISMNEKENNIVFHSGHVRCDLNEADCLQIILSKSYMSTLWKLYPKALATLEKASRTCKHYVSDYSHINTTFEMEQILKSIEKLFQKQEEGKAMVLEAKIRELLYIQLVQHLNVNNKKDFKLEKYKSQMKEVCKYIEQNVQEIPSLRDIAVYVGVCETTLKTAFKYFYGKTVFEYFNDYRLNKAGEFLQDFSHTISEAAFLTGFKHSSHFSTAFKKKYGITPIKYRTKAISTFHVKKAI